MQLQKSLFSFYKFYVLKTPTFLWLLSCFLVMGIILIQLNWGMNKQAPNNYEQCFMQYYNLTRQVEDNNKTNNNTQNDKKNDLNDLTKKNISQTPLNLKSEYYYFLNSSSKIKLYFSNSTQFNQDLPACKIILNTEKISKQTLKEQVMSSSQRKLIQQKKIQYYQQQKVQNINLTVKNYNEINIAQYNQLTSQNPLIYLTANSHVIYLQSENKFQQRHGIKNHAIFLTKPVMDIYPETFFGISSKWWRFYFNQQLQDNQNIMRSLIYTLNKVNQKIQTFYLHERSQYNKKNINNQIKQINGNEDKQVNRNEDKQVNRNEDKQVNRNEGKQVNRNEGKQVNGNEGKQVNGNENISNPKQDNNNKQTTSQSLQTIHYVPLYTVYPLHNMFVNFLYPGARLNVMKLSKMLQAQQKGNRIFSKVFFILQSLLFLIVISALIGLLVRFLFFFILTVFLSIGGCFINKQWGWVYKYFNLIRNREHGENYSILTSFKMLAYFVMAFLGILLIFTLGSRFILAGLNIFEKRFYSDMFDKNIFMIELFAFVSCRSRLSIKYFPRFSFIISVLIISLVQKYFYYNIVWLINLHLIIHFLLFSLFIVFQNLIAKAEFKDDFTPSQDKPRAMYYAGYDISWEHMLPPIWTYFTVYFDLKHFSQRERCLIDRDYQLLYGRLLGMNERQELPEDQIDEEQEDHHKLNQNFSESHQMSLIR